MDGECLFSVARIYSVRTHLVHPPDLAVLSIVAGEGGLLAIAQDEKFIEQRSWIQRKLANADRLRRSIQALDEPFLDVLM